MRQRVLPIFPHRRWNKHLPPRISGIFSLGSILIIILGVLAACGSSSGSGSSGGQIVITEMDYWTNAPTGPVVSQLFQTYEKTHPGIIIKRDAVPFGSLLPKADQEAASHTLPDLLMLDNPDVANFASTGALAPLDSYMQGTYSESDFYAGPLSTMKYNGKTYAFSVGNNDLAIFYNKQMFASAHLTPPTTWDELYADAKALTHGNTYGFAFSAIADEEATWQFEPFLWSNGGSLTQVDSPQSVQALQFLTQMVKSGIASRAVLNWNQSDVESQFQEGHAAMMENGPWNLPLLKQANFDYGVVPLPVPSPSAQPVSPLGGEAWTIPVSNPATEKATWDLINWMEQPQQLLTFDKAIGYIPAIKSTAQTLLQSEPDLNVFANEFNTARARTETVGAKYPSISQVIWTAEQAALSGSLSPQAALQQAQSQINSILNG
jgi:multiple sugar transport system substrate-binding protein